MLLCESLRLLARVTASRPHQSGCRENQPRSVTFIVDATLSPRPTPEAAARLVTASTIASRTRQPLPRAEGMPDGIHDVQLGQLRRRALLPRGDAPGRRLPLPCGLLRQPHGSRRGERLLPLPARTLLRRRRVAGARRLLRGGLLLPAGDGVGHGEPLSPRDVLWLQLPISRGPVPRLPSRVRVGAVAAYLRQSSALFLSLGVHGSPSEVNTQRFLRENDGWVSANLEACLGAVACACACSCVLRERAGRGCCVFSGPSVPSRSPAG